MEEALRGLHAVIGPDSAHLTWVQASLRAAIIFVTGIAYIRAVGPRTFARGSPLDIVISVVIGSNLSRALTGSAAFLPTLAATAVLVALHWLFAFTTRKLPALGRVVKGEPATLIRHGVIDHARLARENISAGDLAEELRLNRTEGPQHVRLATLERSGQISVIKAANASDG